MNANLWWCENMQLWRWSVTKTNRPVLIQQSGQNKNLDDSLKEIKDAIQILMTK
jgi:hypothetical protein